ncbi:MAG: hypothetical protein LC793_04515 [Thermomicrobia bacterium]|nr:hypothetical protein [Thermomicrobia bacterium]MCA1724647.1 hypothetical protein [Thermomicrobia bacterium]
MTLATPMSCVRWFHHQGAWYFSRMDDGTVVITTPTGDTHEIDPFSWASIVASMSVHGEDLKTYEHARDFHDGSFTP